MLRALLKDSLIYTIPTFISRGLSLFLVPLYTRVLTPSDYGSFDLLMTFASLANLTVALEISQGVARFHCTEADPQKKVRYAATALWFTCACYGLFLGLAMAFSGGLSTWIMGQENMTLHFRLGLLFICLNGLLCLLQNQLRWELRSVDYALVSLFTAILTAGGAVWLAYFNNMGLSGLLIGMIIGTSSGLLLGLWKLRSTYTSRIDSRCLREMLAYSTPLVLSGIAIFVGTYIDRLMINHYLSVADVGIYGIGFRFASIATLLMVGIQGALTPLVFTRHQEPSTPSELAKIFRIFTALALLSYVALVLFVSDILTIFTTPAYFPAAQVVVFLAPAIFLSQMYIFAPGIGIAQKTSWHIYINLAGALGNTLLNWLLIPFLGLQGAALATLLSFACIFTAYMALSQRYYPVPHNWKPIGVSVLIAGLFASGLPTLRIDGGILRCGAYLGALLVLLMIFISMGLVRITEIRRGRELVLAFCGIGLYSKNGR